MKRNFKRTLSLILAVLMIVTVVPFSGMAADCDHNFAGDLVIKSGKHGWFCTICEAAVGHIDEDGNDVAGYEFCYSESDEEVTCGNPKVCDVCGNVIGTAEHKFDQCDTEVPGALVNEDAACNEFKEYYKSCVCGELSETETFISEIKGTNHDFTEKSDEYVAREVCGQNIYYFYTCRNCDEVSTLTYADEETTVQHNFVIPTTPSQDALKSKATCTSPAVFYMECDRENCGATAKGIDETKTYTIGNKIDHEFIASFKDGKADDKYLVIPATCSLEAIYSMYCKHCGEPAVENFDPDSSDNVIITEDIKNDKGEVIHKKNAFKFGEPLNHGRIKVTKEAKAATCTADGNTEELTCEYCNTVLVPSEKLPKLGHNPDSTLIQEYKAPTCVQNGQLGKVKCTREGCGAILEVNGKGEWETTKDNLDSFNVTKRGHIDEDGNLVCDREECLSTLEPSDVCTCLCHGTGFMYFIGWILKWFWRLTGTNPYCKCGEAHYAVD